MRFAQSISWAWPFLPFMVFTVVYYLVTVRLDWFSRPFDGIAHQRLVRRWKPERYPSVDVFLPGCGEPIEVPHNTWTHVRRLADRYPGRVVPADAAICVGTCAVYRRAALEENGGATLIEHSEDREVTGLRSRRPGSRPPGRRRPGR